MGSIHLKARSGVNSETSCDSSATRPFLVVTLQLLFFQFMHRPQSSALNNGFAYLYFFYIHLSSVRFSRGLFAFLMPDPSLDLT